MYLLAFETSFGQFSISLFHNGKLLENYACAEQHQQAEKLIPSIEEILNRHKISYADLAYIAVGIGPGSFTGVRIGLGAAKGMAIACKAKLIGISSLEAAAQKQGGGKVYLDASRGDAFFQEFDEKLNAINEAQLVSYNGSFSVLPDAEAIARVALVRIETGIFPEANPLYVRKPDAKFKLRKALPSDLAWLVKTHAESFPTPWNEAIMKSAIAQDEMIIANDIGFIAYKIVAGECEIKTIAVSPHARRNGVALFLCNDLLKKCQAANVEKTFLEVEETNIPAFRLYEKLGFKTISMRKDYYGQGRNALIMQRDSQA